MDPRSFSAPSPQGPQDLGLDPTPGLPPDDLLFDALNPQGQFTEESFNWPSLVSLSPPLRVDFPEPEYT